MPQFPPGARSTGFTTTELMVAVLLVGILAAVAYPSFMSQIRKGRRSEAMAALSSLLQAQERWRSNHLTYADADQLTAHWPAGLGLASTSAGGLYQISISAGSTGTSHAATATAIAGKSQVLDEGCTQLKVEFSAGVASFSPIECWRK